MDDAAADEIVNLWASNSRTRENLENPDVNYYAVSSVNKSGANNVSDGCYYTLILAKNDRIRLCCKNNGAKIKGFVSKNAPGDSDSVAEDEPEYKP